jgi:hypothetical protein
METRRLADELRRAWEGPVWHGPALGELLEEVTAAEAAAHPIPGAHSIWEIVLHATGWAREVDRRLRGGEPDVAPSGRDSEEPRSLRASAEQGHQGRQGQQGRRRHQRDTCGAEKGLFLSLTSLQSLLSLLSAFWRAGA